MPINFAMTDIYGGFAGTTEATVPDEHDKTALVDESKQTTTVTKQKSTPIYLGIILVIVLAVIMGVLK